MGVTFGQTFVCRTCGGTGKLRGMTCAACEGSGLVDTTEPGRPTRPHAVARATDPSTSWAAARSIPEEDLRESQRVILALLRDRGPMTDEQIAAALDSVQHPLSPSGARTRRAELVDAGYVRDTKKVGRTAAGRATIVWEAIPRG